MSLLNDFRYRIASMCILNWREDKVLSAIYSLSDKDIDVALSAYSSLNFELIHSKKSLSNYCHDLLLYTDVPSINSMKFVDYAINAFKYDFEVLRDFCLLSCDKIKTMIVENIDDYSHITIPDFPMGRFEWDFEYFTQRHFDGKGGFFARFKAYRLNEGEIVPVKYHDKITLNELKNYEFQREKIIRNTKDFIEGKPAANALLYGDRGTGKSSTIKALLNEFEELKMIELNCNEIVFISSLYERLQQYSQKFILFIDDLTFAEDDKNYSLLKASLEGSLAARPSNVLIYATTNRRHIIKETHASREGGEVFVADAIDESVSLSERFGLFLTFIKPDKIVYLDIVKKIAKDKGLRIDESILFDTAEKLALRRGGRSPRIASQAVDFLISNQNDFKV